MSPCWGKGQISNLPRLSSTNYVIASIGGIEADTRVGVKNIRGRVLQGFKLKQKHIYYIHTRAYNLYEISMKIYVYM